jgi:hypothetical protein
VMMRRSFRFVRYPIERRQVLTAAHAGAIE